MSAAIECEKSLLGGLLLDFKYFNTVEKHICAKDFYGLAHAEIFEAMKELFDKHKFFDAATVCDHLNCSEQDKEYIYEIAAGCASVANLDSYINIIREKSVQRTLADVAKDMVHEFEDRSHKQPTCNCGEEHYFFTCNCGCSHFMLNAQKKLFCSNCHAKFELSKVLSQMKNTEH